MDVREQMTNSTWTQVGAGVYRRRYDPLDVSVGLVMGPRGATVIDTRNNPAEAQEIINDVAQQFAVPIVAVLNTHAHYDHTFGNQLFAHAGIPIYGHHLIAQHFEEFERPRLLRVQQNPASEPDNSWAEVELTLPSVPIAETTTVELGGRELKLIPLGPGHTETDLAIFIPDAGIWFLGDIIEESGPPMFGSGSFPLGWPEVLRSLLKLIDPQHVLIPGHGQAVDRAFVSAQLAQFEELAQTLRTAYAASIAVDEIQYAAQLLALWPVEFLREAAVDGYAQLSEHDAS